MQCVEADLRPLNFRHGSRLVDIKEGRMFGKAAGGRKRRQMLTDISSKTCEVLKKEAGDRSGWQKRMS